MAENTGFNPINTQEELNNVIRDRITKAKETAASEYKTQLAEKDAKITEFESKINYLSKQIETLNTQAGRVPELEAKVREYETNALKMRIAHDANLPYELADRLTGSDEKTIRADAENLARFFRGGTQTAPMFKPDDDPSKGGTDAALKSLLAGIKNQ